MAEPLLLEKHGAVATITFNKPEKANAMDVKWLPLMTAFLRDVEHDSAIRCVLIRGNGKHFMAGGDLDMVNAFLNESPERRAALAEVPIHEYNVMVRIMRRMSQPVIASVQGGVAGAAGNRSSGHRCCRHAGYAPGRKKRYPPPPPGRRQQPSPAPRPPRRPERWR
jgi:enoyl-CoA hydratase/carnithine racemase